MYIDSVMNYTGSKFKLLEQLLPQFDYTKSNFVDLFCGGGSVWSNVLDKYEKILANDIITDLIGIQKELIESNEIVEKTKELCKTLKESQADYLNLRTDYNSNPSPEKLWALILSCNSNLIRFNQKGQFNQTWGKRTFNSSTEKKVNNFTQHVRKYKSKISFSHRNFNEVEIESNTFFYIDPPYGFIKTENGDIGKTQISEAGYNNFYYQEDDINLYNFCHRINELKSTFVISGVLEHGNQTTWILDKLIKDGFKPIVLDWNYEKINKSSVNKSTKEVIVKNF